MTCQKGGSTIASSKSGVRLVLASASPRRLELLAQVGITPDAVRPSDIVEAPHTAELPRAYAARLARQKAQAAEMAVDEVILAADTVVAAGRRILEKPKDTAEAHRFLTLLSGRRHKVYTAVALRDHSQIRERLVASAVRMKRLSEGEITAYLATGEWRGKAGGYAIQGAAAAFVPWISGSHSAIVGLPLAETIRLLRAAGVACP